MRFEEMAVAQSSGDSGWRASAAPELTSWVAVGPDAKHDRFAASKFAVSASKAAEVFTSALPAFSGIASLLGLASASSTASTSATSSRRFSFTAIFPVARMDFLS